MIGRDAAWFTPPDDPDEWLRDRSWELAATLFDEEKSACTLGDAHKALADVRDDPHIFEWARKLRDFTNNDLEEMKEFVA